MTDFNLAQQTLLDPTALSVDDLTNILHSMEDHKVDYSDIYFQQSISQSWACEDSIVKSGAFAINQGFGIRAINGSKTGFAYSDDLSLKSLKKAAASAKKIAKLGGHNKVAKKTNKNKTHKLYTNNNPIDSIDEKQKIQILSRADNLARSLNPKVQKVNASIAASHETILLINNNGQLHCDIRPMVRFNVSVMLQDGNRMEHGFAGGGGRYDYLKLLDEKENKIDGFVKDAVRQAEVNLESVDAPAGQMSVVLGPGWPGVLLHEAIGHGLEGDFNRKKTSTFSNSMGQKIGSDICTVVDNGTLNNRRGSLNIDDEGTTTQNTTLIENGILKNYMYDKLNSRLMRAKSTGNGRRESYAHLPLPRMTNTYMLPGLSKPDEIIQSVKNGIYAVNFGGGQVDITSGKFVFSASEAYLIKQGKIDCPIKGATLIGDGAEVLKKISMVADDLKLDTGVGVCGKDGQSVPVGVGQPTIRVDSLTVGGTNL
ncbi:MAG: metalloprotease TldD [Gammaproteobacteria bacterium]|nr:MAG: metalloprotease TldD [Gammaproteobacteria bacterium]